MTKYRRIFFLNQQTLAGVSTSHLNHCKKNIPFAVARSICTIMGNQQQKLRHLSKLKENLKKYDYPVSIIKNGFKKALKIPKNELRKLKEKETD